MGRSFHQKSLRATALPLWPNGRLPLRDPGPLPPPAIIKIDAVDLDRFGVNRIEQERPMADPAAGWRCNCE